jgi:hypothetical protein
MKGILVAFGVAIAFFTAGCAAQAVGAQANRCQGPPSQCNTFFGQ